MKKLILLLILAVPAILPAAPVDVVEPESVGMSSARLERLKARLQMELDNEVTGGIQVLVARRGKVVMYENLGHANVEENVPVTDETLFRIFSMTKPVVGVAMMMLYEEGYYSLSDPLAMHIPEFADLEVYEGIDDDGNMILDYPDREPTIQDLMQHTAGFTYGLFGETRVDRLYREKQVLAAPTMQAFIEGLAEIPLLFHPGERWTYSVSVDIQGYLIEKWTGQKLGDFLQERVFDPLGMDQTMAWVPPEKASLLANVYSHADGQRVANTTPMVMSYFVEPRWFSGGGQLVSTADDYYRFSQMLLNGGELDGVRYLAPGTIELMSQNRLNDEHSVALYPGAGFGLNVAVTRDTTKVDYPSSEGEYFWAGLASTVFWIDPEEDLVVIMLTQYLPFNGPHFRDIMHRMVHAAIID